MKTSDWQHASELSQAEWRERVQKYVRKGDRSVEPVYVGREKLFARVAEQVTRATEDGEYGSLTLTVGGAPGVGKSAFIAEATRRYRQGALAVPIELTPDDMRPQTLVLALARELALSLREETHETDSASVLAKLPFVSSEGSHATTKVQPSVLAQAEREGTVPWETLREVFGPAMNGRPIVLFIDEAQTFRRDGTHHDHVPLRLHKGCDDGMVPIIPVYMGLADTGSVLRREAGLTRTVENSMVPLGGLAPKESREYAQCIQAEYLGLTGGVGQASALYRWLVDAGDDWPQHLRSQNAAVAEAMLKADARSLDDLDLEYLQARVKANRELYYTDRAQAVERGRYKDIMREVVQAADGKTGLLQLEELVYRELQRVPHNPPDGQDFVLQMIHSGAIQQTSVGDFFESPIPSYAGWLQRGHHRMPPLSLPKGIAP